MKDSIAIVLIFLSGLLMVRGLLPLAMSRFSPIGERWRVLRDRFLGNPSFALAGAVFVVVLAHQLLNFGLHFRDPEMARTGLSILGVPYTDAKEWHDQGASLACGQGMTNSWPAFRPGYGLFLALFFTWTGPSYLLAVFLNLVLIALTSALLCQIGEKLASLWVGVLVALGFATQQLTLTYPLTLCTETLGLFCSVFSLHQLMHAIETGKQRSFLLAGVLLGLSNLVRPLTLPVFPLYLLVIARCLWHSRDWRGILIRLMDFAGGVALAIGPWLLRQGLVFGFLTISANTADNLYAASTPQYGSWTSEIYQEPGCPTGVRGKYDYFMDKAKTNLKENPRFYLTNVVTSYLNCFRTLSASARPRLALLGVLVILAYFTSWNMRKRTPWQARLSALALGLTALTFLSACNLRKASLDLIMMLLLPLVTRRRGAGLLHVLGLLGSIMGVAMFGMTGADPRLLFILEWGFLLSCAVFLWGLSSRISQVLETAAASDPPFLLAGESSVAVVSVFPRWFAVLRAGVLGFMVVSGIRLAFLTAMTTVPPPISHLLTSEQALESIRAFDRRTPGLLQSADLQQDQVLTCLCEKNGSYFVSHNKILVLPIHLFDYPYYLPARLELPHWSRYFTARDYDRTVCIFQMSGDVQPKSVGYCYPVLFPGFIPRSLYDRDALLICRVHFDSGYSFEDVLFEGIALIPMDESRNFCFDKTYCTTHPHHPGTNPQFATKSYSHGPAPVLSHLGKRN